MERRTLSTGHIVKLICAFLAFLSPIIVAIISACYTNEKYEDLKGKYAILETAYSEYQILMEGKIRDFENQKTDSIDYKEQYLELNKKHSDLEIRYQDLSKQYSDLEDKYKDLEEQYQILSSQGNDPSSTPTPENSSTLFGDVKLIESTAFHENEGLLEDSLGVDYKQGTAYARLSVYNGHAIYFLDNKYSTLEGYISACSSMFDDCKNATIKISTSVDGEKYVPVYTKNKISRLTKRFSTGKIDVSGCNYLRIDGSGTGYWSSGYDLLLLTEFNLE